MQLYDPNKEITLYDLVKEGQPNKLELTNKHLKEETEQAFKKDQSLRSKSLLLKKEAKGVLKMFIISDEEKSDKEKEILLNMKNLFKKV